MVKFESIWRPPLKGMSFYLHSSLPNILVNQLQVEKCGIPQVEIRSCTLRPTEQEKAHRNGRAHLLLLWGN
jgi:hypothetical protein